MAQTALNAIAMILFPWFLIGLISPIFNLFILKLASLKIILVILWLDPIWVYLNLLRWYLITVVVKLFY